MNRGVFLNLKVPDFMLTCHQEYLFLPSGPELSGQWQPGTSGQRFPQVSLPAQRGGPAPPTSPGSAPAADRNP